MKARDVLLVLGEVVIALGWAVLFFIVLVVAALVNPFLKDD